MDLTCPLEVGGVTDTVRVTGEAPHGETETSATDALLEGAYLQQLPQYQRNVKTKFYLTRVWKFRDSATLATYRVSILTPER